MSWEDKKDKWSDAIAAAHPVETGDHASYNTAMEMVGNRHSKRALVEMTCYFLHKIAKLEASLLNKAPAVSNPESHTAQPQELELTLTEIQDAADHYAKYISGVEGVEDSELHTLYSLAAKT